MASILLSRVSQSCLQLPSAIRTVSANILYRNLITGHSISSPKQLEEVMKVDMLEKESPEQIRNIWTQYHADEKQMRVSDVLSAQDFAMMSLNAAKSPMFVLPVKKDAPSPKDDTVAGKLSGSLSVVLQMQMPYVLFTPLLDFQQMGTDATPFFTTVYYSELSESKGMVLCRGDILARPSAGEALSTTEANNLMKLTHRFYSDPELYTKWVHCMNHNPVAFSYEDLLNEVEIESIFKPKENTAV
mmetsp:Transcript_5414/g.7320  ORF Transcript_5414/g.7320 Transcript_5414/m.7320 type:complete len:244 (+) Transcript_5414:87-818(+)|eukprot:CAMPEP_0196586838 /NCGR_PEP_ID=MMETSP1081-20130531/55773_1 /TAXON_ID=36882 /ORGANISM="Pyramimonas amylifera, Strain CCMP720" /LENGTH=243 /DNA_ID=CAMNT_0041908849 /DNA_START=79 /DNA_END=810 /DNA_ORIENTATION=+